MSITTEQVQTDRDFMKRKFDLLSNFFNRMKSGIRFTDIETEINKTDELLSAINREQFESNLPF